MGLRIYKIDGLYLSNEWKPKGEIFYAIRGGDTKEEHQKFCEEQTKKLLDENDNDYSSWRFTGGIFKDLGGYNPYASIIAFRIRDVW